MTAIRGFLRRHRRIALDTNVFIYHLDGDPSYVDITREIFSWIERQSNSAVTSTLTMTELLVHPYQSGDEQQVNLYYGLLSTLPNLEWIAPDLSIADLAAQMRAQHGFRTPDALQVATAVRKGASGFLTNDLKLARVTDLEVGVLDRLR